MRIVFPPHLRRFIELPESCEVDGDTVQDIIGNLEVQFPGIQAWLCHENGHLRKHVNIFLDQRLLTDREHLAQPLSEVDEITIMQALSGG